MKSFRYLIIIFSGLFFCTDLVAKNLYVNINTGNDSWNGESSTWTSGNNGPVKSIQKAIDLSASNDIIYISPGIYRENLLINHQIKIQGSGSGSDSTKNTILLSSNYSYGTGINISFSGTTNLPSLISNIRVSGFYTGVILSRDVVYQQVVSTDNYFGFSNGGNNYLRDLQMNKCSATFNKIAGLQINHACNVIAFIIDSCDFSDNLGGIYAYCDNPSTSNIIDFLLKNSTFIRNKQKGVYVEKLDNSILENLYFDSCGIDTTYNWNAGIDINLKFNNYENISILNSEFYHCGIGGGNNSGCALVVKARDDGSVYGANPATLTHVQIKGIIVKYCQNGIIFGEPGKNNSGPYQISVHESQIVYSHNSNVVSNIQSDVSLHNNCWLTTSGPSASDTVMNSKGKLLIYTWIKYTIDRSNRIGFQSDSIVLFDKLTGSLQNAIDVVPYAWKLFIPDNYYRGSYQVASKIYFLPENIVRIDVLHLKALCELELSGNDLYISDSLITHENSHFYTGDRWQVELSDTCTIVEKPGFAVEGRIRTFRNLNGTPAIENFGGLGLMIKANVTTTFPYNNIVVIRSTGRAAEDFTNKVLRMFEILTHSNCGWHAELFFSYDKSEIVSGISDTHLILMRSFTQGKSWILTGGKHDIDLNMVSIENADYLQALWSLTDSTGKTFPPGIFITSSIRHIDCFGNKNGSISTNIQGGFAPYHFLWSTKDTLPHLDSLPAGKYFLTVTDTGGCIATDSFVIEQPPKLTLSFNKLDIRCHGDNTGQAEVIINGGTKPYRIYWQDGEKTAKIQGKKAGIYPVQVIDTNHCISTDSVIITEPEKFKWNETIHHISCYGKKDGSIELHSGGGTPPYLIFWSTGESGNLIKNLSPGKYNFSIYDSFFCTASDTFTLTEPLELKLSLLLIHNRCYGFDSGQIIPIVSGGTIPYSFEWSDQQTDSVRKNLAAGKYWVKVNDLNKCSVSDTSEIKQPDKIKFSFSVSNDTNQKCIGRISAQLTGGVPPYIAEWDDPKNQKGFIAENLCAGTYTLTVTDSSKCVADSSVAVQNVSSAFHSFPEKVSVYPNPFSDYIYFNSAEPITTVLIIDSKGKVIYAESGNSIQKTKDLSRISGGIYIIRIQTLSGVYIEKTVKTE